MSKSKRPATQNATIAAYNKYASLYDKETRGFWQQFPKSTVDTFVENLIGKKILDAGSGSGHDAVILRNRGLNVTCLDGSSAMVALTKKLGFVSITTTFEAMQFKEASFDGIWCYTALLHLPKETLPLILQKFHSYLKPNGIFLIGMIEGNFKGYVTKETWVQGDRYFQYYQRKELRTLIEENGFIEVFYETYQPRNKVYLHEIYKKL